VMRAVGQASSRSFLTAGTRVTSNLYLLPFLKKIRRIGDQQIGWSDPMENLNLDSHVPSHNDRSEMQRAALMNGRNTRSACRSLTLMLQTMADEADSRPGNGQSRCVKTSMSTSLSEMFQRQTCVMPPSATRSMPVLKLLSSDARNKIAEAISSACPKRPSGAI
jgi:hypothetical protein